jgi:DNA-binding FadR family transcriptional regulator
VRYERRGLHGSTVESIAGRILGGEIAEGETIAIPSLQEEYGVSLTVVREALRVLSAKGLVDARQKRGTFVRPRESWHLLDPDMIRWQFAGAEDKALMDNLSELRSIIEPAAARLAAQRRKKADLTELAGALEDMDAAADPSEAVEADLRFHRALLAATHNELLSRMEVVLATGLAERERVVHGIDHTDNPAPTHAAVAEAIEDKDPDAAEVAMRGLLDKARRDMARVRRRQRRSA